MTHTELLEDIRKNPDKHRHKDLNELMTCCMVDGSIDSMAWEAHEGLQGRNGARGCDVTSGPCSCGAFHR